MRDAAGRRARRGLRRTDSRRTRRCSRARAGAAAGRVGRRAPAVAGTRRWCGRGGPARGT
ncbi:hypothetical protein AN216_16280 [Streptomyces oceani]|uniref:Uncharacterized protein n=1 Tax=Streptomyces oceani TaxID=1075402 RepID=A0A1E7KEU2_9ACTN|nr:hypothetical protein AN216_16280 [Streptomyces oceani]